MEHNSCNIEIREKLEKLLLFGTQKFYYYYYSGSNISKQDLYSRQKHLLI